MKHAGAVLNRIGISDYQESKDEFLCDCILCGDMKKNLQINFVKRVFHCWRCNEGGSIFKLIYMVTGLHRDEATELFKLDEVDVDKNIEETINILSSKTKRVYEYERYLIPDRFVHWEALRGIGKEQVKKFYLGVDEITNRLVIPLMEDGKCLGLTRRAMLSHQQPKYLTTRNFDKSHFIYGYDTLDMTNDTVVITEGCIDTIITRQLGLNSVAIMGVDMTNHNLARLADDFDNIWLMFDNDDAGRMATKTIGERFIDYGATNINVIEYGRDDPGSLVSMDMTFLTPFSILHRK